MLFCLIGIVIGALFILLSDVLATALIRYSGEQDINTVSMLRIYRVRIAWWAAGSIVIVFTAFELAELLKPLAWWRARLW
jgi:hypothetical protein